MTKPNLLFTTLFITLSATLCCSALHANPAEMPPLPVQIWKAEPSTLSRELSIPARAQAVEQVEIRARTVGVIKSKLFHDGQTVKKGTLLFELETDTLEANISSMFASLERARSDVEITKQAKKRTERLYKNRMISEEQLDQAKSDYQTALAELGVAKANLQRAELDLSFSKIYAPISGTLGLSTVSKGDLIKVDDNAVLNTLMQLDPIWINFGLPGRTYTEWRRSQPKLSLEQITVRLFLEKGVEYEHMGRLVFADHKIDPSTGRILFRAQFPNPQQSLHPGQFVRLSITLETPNVIALPQTAVAFMDQGPIVWLVGPENRAVPNPVTLGTLNKEHDGEARWVIMAGLQGGEHVVLSSLQKIQPGTKLQPLLLESTAEATAEP